MACNPLPLHTAAVNVTVRHYSRLFKLFCHLIVSPHSHLHSISYKITSLSFEEIWSTIIFFNSSIEISTSSTKYPQSGFKYKLVISPDVFFYVISLFVSPNFVS